MTSFPASFDHIARWSDANDIPVSEGRFRFAQYAVLVAVSRSRLLSQTLIFKGGNALDLVWHPNRSTIDLDFSVDEVLLNQTMDAEHLRALFIPGLRVAERMLNIKLAVHKVEQQPPGDNRTFITYRVRIGYALTDEPRLRARIDRGEQSTQVILVDISRNDPVYDSAVFQVDEDRPLRICTVEDIVSEKLRALLQQPTRNRDRPQDLLDIAVLLESHPSLERSRIRDILVQKSGPPRNIHVSRQAFYHRSISNHAAAGYAELEATTRRRFIPFPDALDAFYRFIDDLDLPEQ